MRLRVTLPASALLVAVSLFGLTRTPHPKETSPKTLAARAAMGALRTVAGFGDRSLAPETVHSPAPLTLDASRPDSLAPAIPSEENAAIERYHELALESARAKSALVIARDVPGATVKSTAIAEFEKKCAKPAGPALKKPTCTKSALDIPIVSFYLRQATSVLVS